MNSMYLTCLIIGGVYSVVSLLFSGILDGIDFDAEIDFDFGSVNLPIKPFTLMVFVTVFGGAGLIAVNLMPHPWTLIPAVLLGAGLSALLYYLVYGKLLKMETLAASEEDAIMKKADVAEKIMPGGFGKISFVINGNIISGAAKEIKAGGGIEKGARVYILDVRDNVYYVGEDLDFYLEQIRKGE